MIYPVNFVGASTILFILLFFCPVQSFSSLYGQTSLLQTSDLLRETYQEKVAKEPPPSLCPKTKMALESANWLKIHLPDLAKTKESPLELIGSDPFLAIVHELGINALFLTSIGQKDSLSIDPKWGDFETFLIQIKKGSLSLITEGIFSSIPWGYDFDLALRNVGEYPTLFHLIAIDPKDWKHLPRADAYANVPWLSLQALSKKGYVPQESNPYTKTSAWNVTGNVMGSDGIARRWIYLKEGENDPVLSWLSPSFGASRIANAQSMARLFQSHFQMLTIDGKIPSFAKEMNALWIRKLGGFSLEYPHPSFGLDSFHESKSDLLFDTFTRPALLHAIAAEDAEALRLIYRIFLKKGLPIERFIHSLEPFDTFACSWAHVLTEPKKKYSYWQETLTAELLEKKLLREDVYRLGISDPSYIPPSTWVDYCQKALQIKSIPNVVQKAHLLLAFTYAMQPGAFSLSLADLLGSLPEGARTLHLFEQNPNAVYSSLPLQMKNQTSFALQLKNILSIRNELRFPLAKVVDIPTPKNQGCFLLLQTQYSTELPLMTAVNFSRQEIRETVKFPILKNSTAIELIHSRTEEKEFSSPEFSFTLAPLSAKVFLFQKKYYD